MHRMLDWFRRPMISGSLFVLVGAVMFNGCSNDDPLGVVSAGPAAGLVQIDRMAIAAVNTVFFRRADKDGFNAGDPSTDVAKFRDKAIEHITEIRAAVNAVPGFPAENNGIAVDALVDIVIPDVYTVDLSAPIQFPNGRRLQDDVIDAELPLVLNRTGVSDAVANDSTFLGTFPYLGTPN